MDSNIEVLANYTVWGPIVALSVSGVIFYFTEKQRLNRDFTEKIDKAKKELKEDIKNETQKNDKNLSILHKIANNNTQLYARIDERLKHLEKIKEAERVSFKHRLFDKS